MSDVRTHQARALGDTTRAAIFGQLGDSPTPLGVTAISERLGLHHNAVRQHLATLRDAGLVIESVSAPSGRGRPALRYRLAPGVAERWDAPSPFEQLSELLVELLGGGSAFDVGVGGGRRVARKAGYAAAGLDAADAVEAAASTLGFEPRRIDATDDQRPTNETVIVLDRCPFAALATARPDIICELHRGIAVGVATVASGAEAFVELDARPPAEAGCRVRLGASGPVAHPV